MAHRPTAKVTEIYDELPIGIAKDSAIIDNRTKKITLCIDCEVIIEPIPKAIRSIPMKIIIKLKTFVFNGNFNITLTPFIYNKVGIIKLSPA